MQRKLNQSNERENEGKWKTSPFVIMEFYTAKTEKPNESISNIH